MWVLGVFVQALPELVKRPVSVVAVSPICVTGGLNDEPGQSPLRILVVTNRKEAFTVMAVSPDRVAEFTAIWCET